MRILLLCLCILVISSAFAGNFALEKIQSNCLTNKNWKRVRCEINNSMRSKKHYKNSFFSNISTTFGHFSRTIIGETNDILRLGTQGLLSLETPRDIQNRNEIHTALSQYANDNELNDCQKACVIKCSTSSILTYKQHFASWFQGTNGLYNIKEGVCTEYSRLAADLGIGIGLEVEVENGINHYFNSFRINGDLFYGEPQTGRCEFFQNSFLHGEDLREANRILNE